LSTPQPTCLETSTSPATSLVTNIFMSICDVVIEHKYCCHLYCISTLI
jgi:hypothetical protein